MIGMLLFDVPEKVVASAESFDGLRTTGFMAGEEWF
jgi:hypothetical protein